MKRREFLAGAVAATGAIAWRPGWATSPSNVHVVKNRAPLSANAFYMLPIGSIRPAGWLASQLRVQANGLSGHLDETWPDVGPNSGWLGGTGESWERGPYYLDGLIPLAWLLDDPGLKAKAQRFIDWTLDHQAPSGMIGPSAKDDWWPRFVILKALTQYQELTGDPRVIPVMDRYFRYQLKELPNRPLRDWGKFRWQDQVLSIVWLYNRTASDYLLELARLLHEQGYDWVAEFEDFQYKEPITRDFLKLNRANGLKDLSLATHGVNNGQAIKTGPVWSQVSLSPRDRNAAMRMIGELDQYHGMPNGMFSCDEHLAGLDPSQGSELCTVVEYMFSLEHCFAITGEAAYADKLEKLAFNALPGTFTDDMWAHQYNQEPNQVECGLHARPWTTDGPESNLYGLAPNFGCCTANFHQGWPKFANSLFMLSGRQNSEAEDGIVAAAYAPAEVRLTLRGTPIHIVEETEYPFRSTVRFTVNPAAPIAFPFQLRIPGWANGTKLTVNGRHVSNSSQGTLARINRTWRRGDTITLEFPMHVRASKWYRNSVALERGPLVFSLGIGTEWVKLRDQGMTADWQVYPKTHWNYALNVDPGSEPTKSVVVTEAEFTGSPFTDHAPPLKIEVKARRLDTWEAEGGVANPVPESPVPAPIAPEENISLIPYGAAKLRITAFPNYRSE